MDGLHDNLFLETMAFSFQTLNWRAWNYLEGVSCITEYQQRGVIMLFAMGGAFEFIPVPTSFSQDLLAQEILIRSADLRNESLSLILSYKQEYICNV
eukprot:scaffold35634_cov222-Skeletonema_dohrnii-CCMP3373.AAC.2